MTEKDIILEGESLPRLILLCGPCRTGTTALSNVFVRAGIESHMQPIKSMRRARSDGEVVVPWTITNNSSRVIFSKETLGESDPSEFFDPVSDLLDVGYPREKIEVILILRDPRQTLTSWKRMWPAAQVQKLREAFLLTDTIRRSCLSLGVKHSVMVHEAIRDNPPETVASRLFHRLGLIDSTGHISDWRGTPQFGDQDPRNSHLKFYDSPPEVFIDGVRNRGGYKYEDLPIPEQNATECRAYPELFALYEAFRGMCELDLGVTIRPLV
ncbi:MAG: hypothetical protein V1716_05575 [Candidatus Uhrbacteria bacterium]